MTYTSTNKISVVNTPTDNRLQALNLVPLGASCWTTSGNLANHGITAIAQAASGAMTHSGLGYDPTRTSIDACIENSLLLAQAHNYTSLAIPFIGGGAFFHRVQPTINKAQLASLIVSACQKHHGTVTAVIVAHGAADLALFQTAMANNTDPKVTLVPGSITKFADHNCAAITNPANMEVTFGGTLSGIIGQATGQIQAIDQQAAQDIKAFWAVNSTPPANEAEEAEAVISAPESF